VLERNLKRKAISRKLEMRYLQFTNNVHWFKVLKISSMGDGCILQQKERMLQQKSEAQGT
jgi:hypothetical protein